MNTEVMFSSKTDLWETPQQWKGGVVIAKIPAGTPAKKAAPAGISPKSIKTRIDQPEYDRVIVQTERDGTIAYHIIREDKIAQNEPAEEEILDKEKTP